MRLQRGANYRATIWVEVHVNQGENPAAKFMIVAGGVFGCHIAAFEAIGGVASEILYDRMKTAVIGEDAEGVIT